MAEPRKSSERKPRGDGLDVYVRRSSECAFANLKLLSRVMSKVYDDELRPCGLRASQLALLWAIAAMEPVELGRLGFATLTDQTTLSRTIGTLKRERLVSVRAGADRRNRIVSLTPSGRARLARAMPLWENAQQRASEMLPLGQVRELARQLRKTARGTL